MVLQNNSIVKAACNTQIEKTPIEYQTIMRILEKCAENKKICIIVMMSLAPVFAKTPQMDDTVIKYYAEYMNVSDTLIHIPELYVAIHQWIGIPYRYGRSDRKGTDCSGFVVNILHPLCGEKLPRSALGLSQIIQPKHISELREGDLVFFNYYGRTNSHVGIYLQNGWFVHASSVRGVTLNNLYSSYYTQHFSKGGPLKRGEMKDLMVQDPVVEEEQPLLEPLTPIGVWHVEPSKTINEYCL